MRAQRIVRPATAFSRDPSSGRKRPREKANGHLAFVRQLPCCICGSRRDVHAAHIRMASPIHGKRATGMGEKSSDRFTVPLCADHHLFGEGAQHAMSEEQFWATAKIDPFGLALSLWGCSGDEEAGELVVREVRARGGDR